MSKRFVLQLAVMLCSLPALATISNRMYNYEFTGAEYVGYYLLRWVYVFQGYPFVVQASVTVLMFSILMVAFLTYASFRTSTKTRTGRSSIEN